MKAKRVRNRERGAVDWKFLLEVLLGVGVTIFGIYLAARSGYEQALAFSDYQEARQVRNMLEQVERELARNIDSCRRSFKQLEEQEAKEKADAGMVGGPTPRAFSTIQAQTRVWDACHQNPLFFQLDGEVIQGLSRGYADLADVAKTYNAASGVFAAKRELAKIDPVLADLEKLRPILAKQIEEQRALEKRLRAGSKLY